MKKLFAAIAFLVLTCAPSFAQVTLVQQPFIANSANITSLVITPASATTAGSLLVFAIVNPNGSSNTYSLASSGGTTETGIVHPSQCLKQQLGPNGSVDCFYVLSSVGGTTSFTLTYGGAANPSPGKIKMYEFSGCISCSLDGVPTVVLNTTSTTPSGASITSSGSGVVISNLSGGTAGNLGGAITGGFTVGTIDNTDTFAFGSGYILNPSASTFTSGWTLSPTDLSFGNSIAFKSNGSGMAFVQQPTTTATVTAISPAFTVQVSPAATDSLTASLNASCGSVSLTGTLTVTASAGGLGAWSAVTPTGTGQNCKIKIHDNTNALVADIVSVDFNVVQAPVFQSASSVTHCTSNPCSATVTIPTGTDLTSFMRITYNNGPQMSVGSARIGGQHLTPCGPVGYNENLTIGNVGSYNSYAEIWALVNPPTGSQTVDVGVWDDLSPITDVHFDIVTFSNTYQGVACPVEWGSYQSATGTGAGTTLAITIPTDTTKATISVINTGLAPASGTSQTLDNNDSTGTMHFASDHQVGASSSVTHTWTLSSSANAAMVGFAIISDTSLATNDVYLDGTGTGTGLACGNALIYTYYNNSANWSATPNPAMFQIGPGTTVHMCGTVTSNTGPLTNNENATGTAPAGTSSASGLTQDSTSGSGTGAAFTISWTGGVYSLQAVTNGGSGYAYGDTITILGNHAGIGGTTPANDITIPVTQISNQALTTQGNGLTENPVTIKFEPGAILQSRAFFPAAISVSGHNNIAIDGGTNGIIQNTNNGTSGYSGAHGQTGCVTNPCNPLIDGDFIDGNGSNDIVVKNLALKHLFVRMHDATYNQDGQHALSGISISISGSFTNITNNTFSDGYGAIGVDSFYPTVTNNTMVNFNHHITQGPVPGAWSNCGLVAHNDMSTAWMWDDNINNFYHHNAWFIFTASNGVCTNVRYNANYSHGLQSGFSITSQHSIATVTNTGTAPAGTGSAVALAQDATSGAGLGSTWNISWTGGVYTVTPLVNGTGQPNNPGTGFTVGDTITIRGNHAGIGGATPANDLTITVASLIVDSGPITSSLTFYDDTGFRGPDTYGWIFPHSANINNINFIDNSDPLNVPGTVTGVGDDASITANNTIYDPGGQEDRGIVIGGEHVQLSEGNNLQQGNSVSAATTVSVNYDGTGGDFLLGFQTQCVFAAVMASSLGTGRSLTWTPTGGSAQNFTEIATSNVNRGLSIWRLKLPTAPGPANQSGVFTYSQTGSSDLVMIPIPMFGYGYNACEVSADITTVTGTSAAPSITLPSTQSRGDATIAFIATTQAITTGTSTSGTEGTLFIDNSRANVTGAAAWTQFNNRTTSASQFTSSNLSWTLGTSAGYDIIGLHLIPSQVSFNKIKNNLQASLNAANVQAVASTAGVAQPYTVSLIDYNVYDAASSIFFATQNGDTGNLALWQTANQGSDFGNGGFDTHATSGTLSSANLNTSTYVPQSGSNAINAGANLTSLCAFIYELCFDYNGTARSAIAANWDAGAVNSVVGNTMSFTTQPPSSTPTGNTMTVALTVVPPAADSVTISVSAGLCTVTGTTTKTSSGVTGIVSFTVTAASLGSSCTFLAVNNTDATVPNVTSSAFSITGFQTFTIQPASTVSGGSITPTTGITPAAADSVTISVAAGLCTVTGTTTQTASAGGVINWNLTANAAGANCTFKVHDNTNSLVADQVSGPFNVMASSLSFTQGPGNIITGNPFSPVITGQINVAVTDTIQITINGCGASLSGTTSQNAVVSGAVANITYAGLGVTGTGTGCTLTLTDLTNGSVTPVTSTTFNVSNQTPPPPPAPIIGVGGRVRPRVRGVR